MGTDQDMTRLWEARLASLGRMQSRYLWILFVLGLFFWFLETDIGDGVAVVPWIGIALDPNIVSASAPAVLFFLIVVIYGTLRAYGVAGGELGVDPSPTKSEEKSVKYAEALDVAPNAIDMAVFTRKRFGRSPLVILLAAYPLYLTIFAVEGILLWCRLYRESVRFEGWLFFVVAGAALGVVASTQVLWFWWRRLKKIVASVR